MEVKQTILKKVILSSEINGRVYELNCSIDSPLGELHDVLLAMKGDIVRRINESQKQEQEVTDFINNKTDVPPEAVKEVEKEELKEK